MCTSAVQMDTPFSMADVLSWIPMLATLIRRKRNARNYLEDIWRQSDLQMIWIFWKGSTLGKFYVFSIWFFCVHEKYFKISIFSKAWRQQEMIYIEKNAIPNTFNEKTGGPLKIKLNINEWIITLLAQYHIPCTRFNWLFHLNISNYLFHVGLLKFLQYWAKNWLSQPIYGNSMRH